MNFLTKKKPQNFRLDSKNWSVTKVAAVLLTTLTVQVSAAETKERPNLIVHNSTFFKQISTLGFVQKIVKGKVLNESGETLPGVNIVAKGTKISAQTDFNGNFTIEVPDNVTTLIISYIGLQEQEILIGNAPLTIILKEVGVQMNEVIVVGYGQQNRKTLSTSVSKLDKKVLENVPYSNVTQALQGNITGLVVRTSSGQPGKASNILVRGGTSIDNPAGATPLYIVDGVIRNQIDDINSNDIASLQF